MNELFHVKRFVSQRLTFTEVTKTSSLIFCGKNHAQASEIDQNEIVISETFKAINRKNIDKIFTPEEGPNTDFAQDIDNTTGISILAARLFGSLGFIVQGELLRLRAMLHVTGDT